MDAKASSVQDLSTNSWTHDGGMRESSLTGFLPKSSSQTVLPKP